MQKNITDFFKGDGTYLNRMLKDVVKEGGTSADAVPKRVDLCGKTGTSDDYRDNWFIGLTPKYLCGMCYCCGIPETHIKNESASICRDVFSRLPGQKDMKLACPKIVEQLSYCAKTGLHTGKYCAETKKDIVKRRVLRRYVSTSLR